MDENLNDVLCDLLDYALGLSKIDVSNAKLGTVVVNLIAISS